ncbi:MAG: peptide MFS transporter [Proteobacteria bacterium]|nr:peptide MFS transporter [Pseudomonadota bacterium]
MAESSKNSLYQQPKGLYLLCGTELWERFGFYTVQAILILYLTKSLGYTDNKANLIYAVYSSLLYITPMIGGYIADRFLGFQRAILIGGILSVLGYLITAVTGEHLFFIGLSILICANGLFKPNVSAIVGDLYQADDARRDGGFTLFYMGINIGALVPPVIAGVMVKWYGWHTGFLLAAIGMIIGFITFLIGKRRLTLAGKIPQNSPVAQLGVKRWRFEGMFYLGFAVLSGLTFYAFQFPQQITYLVEAAAVAIALVVIYLMFKESTYDRKRILASLILTAISVGFWALYNQTFTSLTLFADRNMQQRFLGIPVNAEAMQFFNPLYIILLSPLLSRFWMSLGRRGLNPSIPLKFTLGVLFLGLGFLILPLGIHFFPNQGNVAASWLVLSYLFQTIGELLLSPVGLSMITMLVPKRLVGMMMGVWFFAQAASFALGGSLANLADIPDNLTKLQSLAVYNHAFLLFGLLSVGLVIVSFGLIPFLKKLTGQPSANIQPDTKQLITN